MDRKIIIILAIIVVLAVLIGVVALNPNQGKDETAINVLSSPTLKNGDAVKFQLMDSKGNPISGQKILISLSNGETKDNYSITTDDDGKGSLVLNDMSPGNYSIMLTYNGNDRYNSSNIVQKLIIEENTASNNSSNVTKQVDESDYHPEKNSSSTDSSSSSQQSVSSNNSVTYDSELNVYYDNDGIVVDPDGEHGMGVGEKYEDLVKQAEEINEKGLN